MPSWNALALRCPRFSGLVSPPLAWTSESSITSFTASGEMVLLCAWA